MYRDAHPKDRIRVDFNSSKRTSGTREQCTLTLTNSITRVLQVEVLSVEMPFTSYVFNAGNNTLTLGGVGTLTITAGTYTGTSLASHIQTLMVALGTMTTPTCTFSINTYKFTLASDVPVYVPA